MDTRLTGTATLTQNNADELRKLIDYARQAGKSVCFRLPNGQRRIVKDVEGSNIVTMAGCYYNFNGMEFTVEETAYSIPDDGKRKKEDFCVKFIDRKNPVM